MSALSVGEIMVVPEFIPGADWGERASVSSRNGLVDRGRSGRALAAEPEPEAFDGDSARFRNGLFEPKVAAVGETPGEIWPPVSQKQVSLRVRFSAG